MEPHQPVSAAADGAAGTAGDEAQLDRRDFLGQAAGLGVVGAAALVGLSCKGGRPIEGALADDGHRAGHALRDRSAVSAPAETRRASIVIVGGGMAGLSAAWWLRRAGHHDFVLLELASETGGNSRAGGNEVSRFPWGAHYLPLPGPRATLVRTLLEEMGILRDGVFDERQLCHAPQERTFVHGRWREGLEDAIAGDRRDHEELARFSALALELRATGAFTIPMAEGARAGHPLDALTADAWLRREGFRTPAVRWLVDYACRDDYGVDAAHASAWAAAHYFAARDESEGPLTWPEGNARIAAHLRESAGDRVITGAPVSRVVPDVRGLTVDAGRVRWRADAVIFAAPTFLAAHVVEGAPRVPWGYAPWLVANLTLDRRPRRSRLDAPESWDNVIADSPGLGYVVATHQDISTQEDGRTVWTYYRALAGNDPAGARKRLLAADWRACAELALTDLERAHPDLRECVRRVDVMRHGHAMPRPEPGFLRAHEPWWRPGPGARVLYANSDLGGLSLFEEAQWRGVEAARRALALVGRG